MVALKCFIQLYYRTQRLSVYMQWSHSITDTTRTRDFVLYSEVSLAQGVIIDHTPLSIMANYAGARLWTMKSIVLMKDLLIFSP